MTEGNWRLGMFVDETRATSRRRSSAQCRGQMGGPMRDSPRSVARGGVRRDASADQNRWNMESATASASGMPSTSSLWDIIPFGVGGLGRPVRFERHVPARLRSNLTMAEAKRSKIDRLGIQYAVEVQGSRRPTFSGRLQR